MTTLWLLSLLAATPFEGVIHMKVKTSLGDGTVKVSVARGGVRSDGQIRLGARDLKTAVVVRAEEPTTSYLHDSMTGKWQKQPSTPLKADGPYTAKALKPEKVSGVLCQHVLLSDSKGGEMEYWTAPAGLFSPEQSVMLAVAQKMPEDVAEALKRVNALGFVMKMNNKRKGTVELSLSTERLERKKVPAESFEVPPLKTP